MPSDALRPCHRRRLPLMTAEFGRPPQLRKCAVESVSRGNACPDSEQAGSPSAWSPVSFPDWPHVSRVPPECTSLSYAEYPPCCGHAHNLLNAASSRQRNLLQGTVHIVSKMPLDSSRQLLKGVPDSLLRNVFIMHLTFHHI